MMNLEGGENKNNSLEEVWLVSHVILYLAVHHFMGLNQEDYSVSEGQKGMFPFREA